MSVATWWTSRHKATFATGPKARCVAAFLMLAVTCFAARAQAGLVVSASVGYGHEFYPLQAEQATNIMVTPGYSLLADIVRPELGIVGAYGALRGGLKDHFQLELRPMLRVSVPLLPLYARAIVAGLRLSSAKPALAYGGAIGCGLQILGVGIFGEIGVLPRHLSDGFHWVGEARAGASYAF